MQLDHGKILKCLMCWDKLLNPILCKCFIPQIVLLLTSRALIELLNYRYQQSNRDERFSQYDQDNNFQGYNASVQAVVTAAVASSAITQVPPVWNQSRFCLFVSKDVLWISLDRKLKSSYAKGIRF